MRGSIYLYIPLFKKKIQLLEMKGLLTRVYTQNIDAIEFLAGLPPEKVSQSIRSWPKKA